MAAARSPTAWWSNGPRGAASRRGASMAVMVPPSGQVSAGARMPSDRRSPHARPGGLSLHPRSPRNRRMGSGHRCASTPPDRTVDVSGTPPHRERNSDDERLRTSRTRRTQTSVPSGDGDGRGRCPRSRRGSCCRDRRRGMPLVPRPSARALDEGNRRYLDRRLSGTHRHTVRSRRLHTRATFEVRLSAAIRRGAAGWPPERTGGRRRPPP